jgi:hypothetical protein
VFFESKRQSGQQGVCAKDAQHAIELMGEFDGFSSVAAMSGQGWQGDGLGAQGNGVIGGDDPVVAQAEAAGEIEAARQGAEVVRGIGSGTGEAQVVVDAEEGEHGVGLWQSGSTGEAEFAHQPVLASAPGAFDAAFGLGVRLHFNLTLRNDDFASLIRTIPGTDASLNLSRTNRLGVRSESSSRMKQSDC